MLSCSPRGSPSSSCNTDTRQRLSAQPDEIDDGDHRSHRWSILRDVGGQAMTRRAWSNDDSCGLRRCPNQPSAERPQRDSRIARRTTNPKPCRFPHSGSNTLPMCRRMPRLRRAGAPSRERARAPPRHAASRAATPPHPVGLPSRRKVGGCGRSLPTSPGLDERAFRQPSRSRRRCPRGAAQAVAAPRRARSGSFRDTPRPLASAYVTIRLCSMPWSQRRCHGKVVAF